MKHLLFIGAVGALLTSASVFANGPSPFGGEEFRLDSETGKYRPLSLYGDFRYSLAVRHEEINNNDKTHVDTEDNNSRIGLGGSISTLRDADVFYNISFYNDADDRGGDDCGGDTIRDLYAGLRGNWGEVFVGSRRTVYQEVTRWVDPFYDTSTSFNFNRVGGSYGTFFRNTDGIQDDQIGYRSPRFGPISFNAAVFSDDSASRNDDIGVELGISVGGRVGSSGHWGASANVLVNTDDAAAISGLSGDSEQIKLAGGVDFGMFGIGMQIELVEENGKSFSNSPKAALVGATMDIRELFTIAATIGAYEDTGDDGVSSSFGVFAHVNKNVDIYGIVSATHLDGGNDDEYVSISVGTSIHFNVGLI